MTDFGAQAALSGPLPLFPQNWRFRDIVLVERAEKSADASSCVQPAAECGTQGEVKMSVSFKSKSSAIRNARKVLGADAQNSVDFDILQDGETYSWQEKTSGKTLAELVEAAPAELPEYVALSLEDNDLGTFPAEVARNVAQDAANEYGRPVTMRNPVTDEVIEVVSTTIHNYAPEGEPVEAPAEEAAPEVQEEAAQPVEQAFPERNFKEEMRLLLKSHKLQIKELTATHKNEVRALVMERKEAEKAMKVARASSATRKATATRTARATVDAANGEAKGPKGKTADVIALAMRPEGATVAELVALTGWTKAPWSWNFTNPQGTGWCQKFGYTFRAEKGEDRKVRYFLTAK